MATPRLALTHHFATLTDPRVVGRTKHRLVDLITIAVCAVIAGADDWAGVATFAHHRRDWLQRFLALPAGTPSHDTFERFFSRFDPAAFQRCLCRWLETASGTLGLKQIAIDGKALCGSADRAAGLGPLLLVSAWAVENRITLGQVAADGTSNEITAIPELLELLSLKGALVTIDAAGCQREIAAQIVSSGGDYALAVKGNQPRLLEDLQEAYTEAVDNAANGVGPPLDGHETLDTKHGRVERRHYTVLDDLSGVRDRAKWAGLTAFGVSYCERTVAGVTSCTIRYYILSRRLTAEEFGRACRSHWGIENELHWQLDVTFGEDASRIRSRVGCENFGMLRRLALALLKRVPYKRGMKCKRLAAATDTDFLEEILLGTPKLEKV